MVHYSRLSVTGIMLWALVPIGVLLALAPLPVCLGLLMLMIQGAEFVGPALARREAAMKQLNQRKCRICGYDLRATPDRCPECGAVPAKPG